MKKPILKTKGRLKQALDTIATFHLDSGDGITRCTGLESGIVVYVVSDPKVKADFEDFIKHAIYTQPEEKIK